MRSRSLFRSFLLYKLIPILWPIALVKALAFIAPVVVFFLLLIQLLGGFHK